MLEDFFNTALDEQEYICGNRFIDLSNGTNILFSKIDHVSEFFAKDIDTFISHNGDFSVDLRVFENGPKHKRWFAQNKSVNKPSLFNIPIGLENFEPEFSSKSQFGRFSSLPSNGMYKKDYIFNLSLNENNHKDLVYMNFNSTTYPSERNLVKKIFNNCNWVTKQENIHWKEYYNSLASSKFCFSPRGNGIDCHRTWEALYLRTIPIIKKEFFVEEFKDLPILFIDNWQEITEEFLLKKYHEFSNMKFNLEKLKMSFWRNIICS